MSNQPSVDQLQVLIAEILRITPEEVQGTSRFFADLGAESLDLMELSFVLQRRYGVAIDRALKNIATTPEGLPTAESTQFIRRWAPGFQPEAWKTAPSKRRLVDLLTTESFVRLVTVLQAE